MRIIKPYKIRFSPINKEMKIENYENINNIFVF